MGVFCSDARSSGECRTLGPADYASRPPGFDDRISSRPRISNDCPFNQGRTWQR